MQQHSGIMKKLLLTIVALGFFSSFVFSQEIKLEGVYNGENLIVLNPFGSTGVGFCVYGVTVNGETATSEINSSTFEINFLENELSKGDQVNVVIRHKPGCTPEIINKHVIKPKSTYELLDIRIDQRNSVLTWTTRNETGKLPFTVQQYRWNKWTNVKRVMGNGTPEKHTYSAKVHTHSGKNRFRVKQTDYTKRPNYSRELSFMSLKKTVTFNYKKFRGKINFSAATKYEIFDAYGRKIMAGYGDKIDVSDIDKGTYYINYDNSTESFEK